MVRTYNDLYLGARKTFSLQEDPQTASLLARNLLCHCAGISREQMVACGPEEVPEEVCAAMDFAVARVLQGEPLAYVLGQWEFYGMTLQVDPHVLIPRDDTCAVAALAIRQGLYLPESPRILDLCTGSGCIGLAIAAKLPDAKVTLADLSRDALAVARKNIGLQKLSARVTTYGVDALKEPPAFLGKFDMIVSNPPYITRQEMQELPHSVKDYEPHMALFGGEDGLDFYRAITKNYARALKPGGLLCYEFGMGQGDDVCRILEQGGFTVLERTRDSNGIERAVLARYDRKEDTNGD